MKLYKVDFKKVRKHFVFSLILRKRMIPYRDGLWYRMWEMGIQGKLLASYQETSIMLIVVVYF